VALSFNYLKIEIDIETIDIPPAAAALPLRTAEQPQTGKGLSARTV